MKEIKLTDATMAESLAQIDGLSAVNPKEKSCLRLLTEEMYAMCTELLNTAVMDFSVGNDGTTYTLRTVTRSKVGEEAREQFLSMSSTGKNEANRGIRGMLGAVLETLATEDNPALYGATWSHGMCVASSEYTCMWSLSQYMATMEQEEAAQSWDGMEKSIIASFADDIAIGVRNGKVEMTVTKKF